MYVACSFRLHSHFIALQGTLVRRAAQSLALRVLLAVAEHRVAPIEINAPARAIVVAFRGQRGQLYRLPWQ